MSIQIEGLYFNYDRRPALSNINLTVNAGSIVGLLGDNGSGKSTLFRILCGLLKPLKGSISVGGFSMPLCRASAQAATGYVAQKFGLYEDLTVEENLRFYARAYGLDSRTATARVGQLLEQFELTSRKGHRAGVLSQGWKQRLAFAAALSHKPSVLLLDEVTAGLDPVARKYSWGIIQGEAARGASVLLSTHYSEEADRCEEKVWLDNGRMLLNREARRDK